MIISDLNHLESVSQTVEITGGVSSLNAWLSSLQGFTVTALSQSTQDLGPTTVTSTAGILRENGGQTQIAFATSSSVRTPA